MGEPGGECFDVPIPVGLQAYDDGTKYCSSPTSVSRQDPDSVWRCHDCNAVDDSGVGCPCNPLDDDPLALPICPGSLTCLGDPIGAGEATPQYPFGQPGHGHCYEDNQPLPNGFCEENCEAQARNCGSIIGQVAECVTEACGELCELKPGNEHCDQSQSPAQCSVEDCSIFGCPANQVCTSWGACV